MGLFSTIGNAFVNAEKSTLNFITKESHDFEDWSKGFDKRSHGFSNFIPFYGLAKAEANIWTSIDDESKGKISLGRMFGNLGEDVVMGVISGYTSATGLSALGGAVKGISEGGIQALSNVATEQTARAVGQRAVAQGADAGIQSAIDSAREEGMRYRKFEVKEMPKASLTEKITDKFSKTFKRPLNKPQQVERIVKNLPKPEIKPKPEVEMKTTQETFSELPDTFKEIFDKNITSKSNRTKLGLDKNENINQDFTDKDFEDFDLTDDDILSKPKPKQDFTDKDFEDFDLTDDDILSKSKPKQESNDKGMFMMEDADFVDRYFKKGGDFLEKTGEKDAPKVEKGMSYKFDDNERIQNEASERSAFDSYAQELKEYEQRQSQELQKMKTNPNWRDISANKSDNIQENIDPQEDLDRAYNLIKQDLPENPAEKLSNRLRKAGAFKLGNFEVSII